MDNYPDKDGRTLTDRVADIEKCIGDIAAVLEALRYAVAPLPSPTCPPYCGHEIEYNYHTDDIKLEYRVAEICRYIGDYGNVFAALQKALPAKPPPCPPYCGHDI